MNDPAAPEDAEAPQPHQRRRRYPGKNPRHFADKYKERDPARYGETVAKVVAGGKTPAGSHRPIMVDEVVQALAPQPGDLAVDCTLGYGGHAGEILTRLRPGGHLIGLDVDPIELPKTEARLRSLGFGPEIFTAVRMNFAGLPKVLSGLATDVRRSGQLATMTADVVLADLGVSSMQLDDPGRGFSVKAEGPLDMRMNPQRRESASALLQRVRPAQLERLLLDNSDEPRAGELAQSLAGARFESTTALVAAIRTTLPKVNPEERELAVRRVFQALRIAVNDEFGALDMFLRNLPACLSAGGRVAILSFHSGEDRRVKRAFEAGLRDGAYVDISDGVTRASPAERHSNPRSTSAKLRWARRSDSPSAAIISSK